MEFAQSRAPYHPAIPMSKETPSAPADRTGRRMLVTGASGFIGRIVAREAAAEHEVFKGSRRAASQPDEITIDWDSPPAELAAHIARIAPDCIVHAAGSASVAASIDEPEKDRAASLGTWSHLLEAVKLSGLKPRVIFPSSAAVYGNPASLPVSEEAPLHPISPYGRNKTACESHECRCDARIIIARLFSVFGPSQKRLLVHELFEKFTGASPEVMIGGTGNESRDFLSEWCVARAMVQLATCKLPADAGTPLILNLASGEEHSILNVANTMAGLLGSRKNIRCLGRVREGDPLHWRADITRLRNVLPGWQPLPFREALDRTLRIWKA